MLFLNTSVVLRYLHYEAVPNAFYILRLKGYEQVREEWLFESVTQTYHFLSI